MENNKNKIAIALLILATLIWSSTFAVIKDAMDKVDPFFINFSRSLIAALPLLIFTFIKNKKSLFNKSNFKNGLSIGLILALTYGFQNLGMLNSSAGNTAFIISSNVIFVPLILFLFYKHRLNGKNIISISLVAFGLFFLSFESSMGFNFGDILSLMSAIVTALHIILTGRFVKTNDFLALLTYQFLFTAFFSLLFNLFYSPDSITFNYDLQSWASIFYLGILGTLICYFIAIWSQKYLSYITVTLIYSLEPVFAAFFAYLILGEVLKDQKILGAALILFGVIISEIPFRKLKIFR